MAIEIGIWRIDKELTPVEYSKLDLESRLQDILCNDISIADPNLMVIGREVLTAYGKRIDIQASCHSARRKSPQCETTLTFGCSFSTETKSPDGREIKSNGSHRDRYRGSCRASLLTPQPFSPESSDRGQPVQQFPLALS